MDQRLLLTRDYDARVVPHEACFQSRRFQIANIQTFEAFPSKLDDFFKGTFLRPFPFDFDEAEMQIKINVTRNDAAYTVEAEMPGMKKDDIHVTVDGSMVTIAGEVKKEKEEKKGEQVVRSERYFGKVARSFSLPRDINGTAVSAKYEDGVLRLSLPLREKRTGTTIEVG